MIRKDQLKHGLFLPKRTAIKDKIMFSNDI